jgi:cyclophilin family peptidyl-prolyl cis-trans isomerase
MNMISKSGGIWSLKGSKKPFTGIGYVLSDTSGKKIIESKYLNGQLHGPHSEWWHNGKKKTHGRYKKGKRHGRWVEYHNNGNIFTENSFKSGVYDGSSSEWHENGTLHFKGKYKQGEKLGSWEYWDDKGRLIEYACIKTRFGEIILDFFEDHAPVHVKSFKDHVRSRYYDGTIFHRVVPDFVIQGGDPNTRLSNRKIHGKGGAAASFYGIGAKRDSSSWRLPAELNEIMHERGVVSMARGSNINSAGSQFFICVTDLPNLDGNYTVFGKVLDGMDVVDKIMKVSVDFRDNPIERVEMEISICN